MVFATEPTFLQEAKRTAGFIKSNQPTECEYKTLRQVKHFRLIPEVSAGFK